MANIRESSADNPLFGVAKADYHNATHAAIGRLTEKTLRIPGFSAVEKGAINGLASATGNDAHAR